MEETWRWFGPADAIRLPDIRQAGARGIVTALHDVPYGAAWDEDAIAARQALVAADPALGLRWRVVESLPVPEAVRRGDRDVGAELDAYRRSLEALGRRGLRTVCYNFMPLLDWTSTDLAHPVAGGGTALRFDAARALALDWLMLGRPGADAGVPDALRARARAWHGAASEGERAGLLAAVMSGLPGAFPRYDLPGLRRALDAYGDLGADGLRANLARFLAAVVPAAEAAGVTLCLHPDDPPRPLLGLPRVVSTEADLAFAVAAVPSPANGLTLCTGSLGANPANDVPGIARRLGAHVRFAHLRNVAREPDGSFTESAHLGGAVNLVAVVDALTAEQERRRAAGAADWRIPFRPDHGHALLDDAARGGHPGYPLVGRLKGLAELRGVIAAVAALRGRPT